MRIVFVTLALLAFIGISSPSFADKESSSRPAPSVATIDFGIAGEDPVHDPSVADEEPIHDPSIHDLCIHNPSGK